MMAAEGALSAPLRPSAYGSVFRVALTGAEKL